MKKPEHSIARKIYVHVTTYKGDNVKTYYSSAVDPAEVLDGEEGVQDLYVYKLVGRVKGRLKAELWDEQDIT